MITVYEIQPYFDSYIHDMEQNLEMDPDTWKEYETDPTPFLNSLLSDFHVGEWSDEEIRSAVQAYIQPIEDERYKYGSELPFENEN